jgi:chromate transporter
VILLHLFWAFAKVGALGFGGGPSMLPLMQGEVVRAGWLTDEQFLEGLAVGNALPGPIATKMAVYVGYDEAGVLGALFALVGVIAPSALLMGSLIAVLTIIRDHPLIRGGLSGARPAVVGMLFFVAATLAPDGVRDWIGGLLAVGAFAALWFDVHPALVMVAAIVLGMLIYR